MEAVVYFKVRYWLFTVVTALTIDPFEVAAQESGLRRILQIFVQFDYVYTTTLLRRSEGKQRQPENMQLRNDADLTLCVRVCVCVCVSSGSGIKRN
jgi:hypothetical protein